MYYDQNYDVQLKKVFIYVYSQKYKIVFIIIIPYLPHSASRWQALENKVTYLSIWQTSMMQIALLWIAKSGRLQNTDTLTPLVEVILSRGAVNRI